MKPAKHPCDVHRVAGQCGIKILKPDRKSGDLSRKCFCPKTLKRIGQAHGEDHLRLVLRLIVESDGNSAELQMDTIAAVSAVVLSGVVEITADMFDTINLGEVRAWAQFVKPGCSTTEAMATALLWLLASPDRVIPRPSAEEAAAEAERRAIVRKGRENAKRRRLAYTGAEYA